jgi:hypothetical protein
MEAFHAPRRGASRILASFFHSLSKSRRERQNPKSQPAPHASNISIMPASTEPSAILSHLHYTDGSATFSQNGYTIIGAVNGPIEVQRRDELPEEAAIDVIVRPAAGVGSTRERHLESIIERTLRQIILISNFPRTLIQVTLQVTSTPGNETTTPKLNQSSSVRSTFATATCL